LSDASFIDAVEQAVYIRKTPKVNGETGGWHLDANLRCQSVVMRRGGNPGEAKFVFVPTDNKVASIEDVLNRHHPDRQVRVETFPYGNPMPVFEGVLERQPCRVVSHDTRVDERSDFIGLAMPWIDNRSQFHVVTGRWFYDTTPGGGGWDRVDSSAVPAVFNYRGRGNMDGDAAHTANTGGITARPFTHDDDLAGQQWTVGEAMKSVLAQWLFGGGGAGAARPRATGVASATVSRLNSGQGDGLADVLPETDVSGLGVLDALAAVCAAGGFEFAVVPDMTGSLGGDRLYVVRIWRRHEGDLVDLMLPKRGKFPSSASATLRRANVSNLHIMRDTAGIVNEVLSRGRVLIEVGLKLKPLWDPADMADTGTVTLPETHALPARSFIDAYHKKHVIGGDDFLGFKHIGRRWGLDCTGASASGFYPSGSAPYDHDPDGIDWLTDLGLNGSNPLAAERTANNVTDPIVWTQRLRRALPLRRADALDTGLRYILELSEDGGNTFTDVTGLVSFTTLPDFLGIQLNNLPNLAAVNLATLGTDTVPQVADSWYQKILDKQLIPRLTCLIEADHASSYFAPWQATSGTGYSRFSVIHIDAEEIWSHTDSALNTSGGWQKQAGAPGTLGFGGDPTAALRGAAERLRDAGEGTRWSVGASTFLLQPDRWRVGDSVRGVVGRDISFATNAGSAVRYPAIVEVELKLCGPDGSANGQGVFLSLSDTAQRGGV